MRRLPVYFVIDVSDSMIGEPLAAVKGGLESCFEALQSDPYALETAYINVIEFAGKVKKTVNMEECYLCHIEDNLDVGSGTAIGRLLDFLMDDIKANVKKSTPEAKGDWRPIIFFFTDGSATDDYKSSLEKWKLNFRPKTHVICIALGDHANMNLLAQLSEDVINVKNVDRETVTKFFRWISSSISSSSAAANQNKEAKFKIENAAMEGVDIVDDAESSKDHPDDGYVILHGQCSENKGHYLLKYEKKADGTGYRLISGYRVNISRYNEMTDEKTQIFKVHGNQLDGGCSCPFCENSFGLVYCCKCGKIHCADKGKELCTCPWCGSRGKLGYSDNLEFSRTLG